MADDKVPERVGRYQIRGELGRGMTSVVYDAYDPSLRRGVALKVVRLLFAITEKEREAFERRFVSEARIAARLSHPGIVVIHDADREPETGVLFMALERLEGRTLAQLTAEGARLPWRRAAEIVARVAQALDYAHGQGVVHRDVKPGNIMVLASGEPKIMDFGLARHATTAGLTVAGQPMGTPLYMSPEQVKGQIVDGRSDLFSLGSVLYTALTGVRAFAAENVQAIMARVAQQEPAPPSAHSPDLAEALDRVVARALAKDPERRYPDGQRFASDLDDVLAGRPPRSFRD